MNPVDPAVLIDQGVRLRNRRGVAVDEINRAAVLLTEAAVYITQLEATLDATRHQRDEYRLRADDKDPQ